MRMDQYLTNTDYSLWQVNLNGDGPIQVITNENGVETEVPPKTTQALLARQRERKAKSILLLAIPDEHQLRFHAIKDAKTLWAAIKSTFGGNVESKKMQKNVLKQQFENFSVSDTEGLDKAYDRNKAGIDDLDIDDLYNNLKVFEADIKDTSSSNEVSTANGVPTAAGHNSQGQASSSAYTNELMYSFFANQPSSPQLDDEDLEQIDHDDLEEMDLKWQVAMLSMRVKRLYKKTGRKLIFNGKEPVGYRSRDNTRRTVPVKNSDALVVQENALIIQDGLGYDWSYVAQDEPTSLLSWPTLQTPQGLTQRAQLIVHQKNEVVYEEKIAVLEFEVKDKSNAITRLKNQLDETLREKDDLKAKLEQFETSSKNLNKLINSQLSAKDKTGLGYGDQLNENDSSGSELFNSVFDSRSSDGDDNQTNDRFKKDNGYHVVPPPLTGNYMPPLADLSFAGLDDSVYRPTTNKTSASVSQVEASTSQTSNTSVEMPRVESVRPSGVIIEDWVSDDEDIFQSNDLQATDKPSFKRIEFTNARNESVKPKQAKKPRMITQNPKVDRRDWNGQMTQKLGLGFGFTKKACFVCGSYSHLIKDYDFHEKRMAKSVLKDMEKVTSHREVRPVWNNTQRINHQNKFVPSAVLTRFGRVPVSAAKQSSFRVAVSTSAVKQVNTTTHTNRVNVSKTRTNTFHKSHSPIRRLFHKSTAPNTSISNEIVNTVSVKGVNTAGQTAVSAVKGNRVTAVKASTGCVWRPKMIDLNNVSKDNSGSWVSKRGNPQQALKNKGIFNSGCSRHMTGNKDFLTDYQDIDGCFVAFGGGTRGGKITVLFTKTECLVLSPDFKLLDENQVLLRVPWQSNMYSFDLRNVVPFGDLTCLFANATIDESKLWHRRMGHVNFKTMYKLVKENLVRGLPSKIFVNNHTCVACQKGKQHKASWNQTNKNAGPQETNGNIGLKKNVDAGQSEEKNVSTQQYIVFPLWSFISSSNKSLYETDEDDTADNAAGEKPVQKPASENEQALKNVLDKMMDQEKEAKEQSDAVRKEFEAQCNRQNFLGKTTRASSTNSFNTVSTPVNTAGASRLFGDVGSSFVPLSKFTNLPHDPLMPDLEDTVEVQNTGIFGSAYDDDDLDTCNSPYADQVMGAEADFNNMEPSTVVYPIPTTRVHSIHPKYQIIGDPRSAVQTRGMIKKSS
ncbi:ribonuclease H-like domain-containing protein [Tanacetum coccineum]|uniref:Ribonuclease H-like domain-containing protein n=1 Tax=Tanacetum coccineum TaxID=301880 RepID=A0ABQ4XTQ4_9ASTR